MEGGTLKSDPHPYSTVLGGGGGTGGGSWTITVRTGDTECPCAVPDADAVPAAERTAGDSESPIGSPPSCADCCATEPFAFLDVARLREPADATPLALVSLLGRGMESRESPEDERESNAASAVGGDTAGAEQKAADPRKYVYVLNFIATAHV